MVKQTNVSILHAIFPLGFFHVPRSEEPSHLKRLIKIFGRIVIWFIWWLHAMVFAAPMGFVVYGYLPVEIL